MFVLLSFPEFALVFESLLIPERGHIKTVVTNAPAVTPIKVECLLQTRC